MRLFKGFFPGYCRVIYSGDPVFLIDAFGSNVCKINGDPCKAGPGFSIDC